MNVIIDLTTKKVKGVYRKKDLFEFEVQLLNSNVEKTINNQIVKLSESPSDFTFNDIIEAKGKQILENTMNKYIILNEELDEDDLDLKHLNNSANTGVKFLQVKPKGQCITKEIQLIEPSTNLELYLESEGGITTEYSIDGNEFINFNKSINLSSPIESIYVKFINTNNEPKEIFSYGILI